jgi:WD40 repeat protein
MKTGNTNKLKNAKKKLLSLAFILSFAGAFAAQESGQEPRMMLAAQAAMEISRELNLDEDQQKMLSARLNEMADPHTGFVDFTLAQTVAREIQALPTQAGPAPINKGEMEEKEESEQPKKSVKKYKFDPSDETEVRRALIALNKRMGSNRQDPKSKLFPQFSAHIASFKPGVVAPWNIQFAPGELSKEIDGTNPTYGVRASADGRYWALLSSQSPHDPSRGIIRIWDTQTMKEVKQFNIPASSTVIKKWAISPTGDKILYFIGGRGHVYDVQRMTLVCTFDVAKELEQVSFSSDGLLVIVQREEPSNDYVRSHYRLIYDVRTGALLDSINLAKIYPTEPVFYSTLFSPDRTRLATVAFDEGFNIKVWNLEKNAPTLELRQRIKTKNYEFPSLVFDNQNRLLAIPMVTQLSHVAYKYNVEIWDLEVGKKIGDIELPGRFLDMTFSPDGHHLAVSQRRLNSYSSYLAVWNLAEVKRQYLLSQAQAGEQESKAESESKEVADAPAPGAVRRKLTVEEAMREFPGDRFPKKEQRIKWEMELEQMAADSADGTIEHTDAWQLFEDIKNWQSF